MAAILSYYSKTGLKCPVFEWSTIWQTDLKKVRILNVFGSLCTHKFWTCKNNFARFYVKLTIEGGREFTHSPLSWFDRVTPM